MSQFGGSRFEPKNMIVFGVIIILLFIWAVFGVGLRTDHLFILGSFIFLNFASQTTHKILISLGFFITFWVLYDAMRFKLNYEVNPVHIIEPYELEKALFGIKTAAGVLTPNEWFKNHYNFTLDFISGFYYVLWMPAPVIYIIWRCLKKDGQNLINFGFTFLISNFIGLSVYYLYPAAPPWYVDMHGFELDFTVPGSAARLTAFDDIIGLPLYEGIYGQNANVFGAIPSMHAAYPVILYWFVLKLKKRWLSISVLSYVLGTWFGAVYSMHHYIIDVILGIICAIFAIFNT